MSLSSYLRSPGCAQCTHALLPACSQASHNNSLLHTRLLWGSSQSVSSLSAVGETQPVLQGNVGWGQEASLHLCS